MNELILKERELKEDLVKSINESGLPAFIIKSIVKDIFEQVTILEQSQYKEAQEKINDNKEKEEKSNG